MIDSNFAMAQLGQYVSVQGGYAYKRGDFQESGIPVLKIKNVRMRYVDISEVDYIDAEIADKTSRFFAHPGDILISMTGSTINVLSSVVGRVARYTGPAQSYLINQRVGRFVIDKPDEIDSRYLFFVLLHPDFQFELAVNATGSANQANISGKQIESLEIPLPPLPTQRRIAQILGRLDDKIELNRRLNRTLEAMAQALFKHHFVDFGPYQDGDFVDSELGLIPRGWEVGVLDDLGKIVTGKTPSTKVEGHFGGDTPFITPTDMEDAKILSTTARYLTEKGVNTVKSAKIPPQTIIVSCIGSAMGKVVYTVREAVTNQQINSLVVKDDRFREYAYYNLSCRQEELRTLASGGSAVPILNKGQFSRIKILIPPASVLERFEQIVSPFTRKMIANVDENRKLAEIRDYLLPKLLSGEVGV